MTDHEIKGRILQKAEEHFLKLGYSKVTMNEIAEDLGMSKKTLYVHFQSKEELLKTMIFKLQNERIAQINALLNDTQIDFIEKLRQLLNLTAEFHKRITPDFLKEINRCAPGSCADLETFVRTKVETVLSSLFREGIEKKVFRNDIDVQLLVMMHVGAVQYLIRSEVLEQLPLTSHQVLQSIGRVMFYGILTDEGRLQLRERAAVQAPLPTDGQP
jgi:AcrR family transcriptional regulator